MECLLTYILKDATTQLFCIPLFIVLISRQSTDYLKAWYHASNLRRVSAPRLRFALPEEH